MQIIKSFQFRNLKYSFINKFNLKKVSKIPKINKLMLSFKSSLTNLKKIGTLILALKLLTNNKNKKIKVITTKKPNLMLKIKKGTPIGCKVSLEKRLVFLFFKKILSQNLSIKSFYHISTFSIDNLKFKIFNNFYSLFKPNLTELKINVVFSKNSKEEIYFWFKRVKAFC